MALTDPRESASTTGASRPGVVLAADYLTQRGGAERVVLAMTRAFPESRIVTAAYHPEQTYPEFASREIETLWPDRVGPLRRDPRLAMPVLASAWSGRPVDADVVLASSSGWAHGVRTDGRKVVYCHNPARWLYQPDDYFGGAGAAMRVARPMVGAASPLLRRWDRKAALSADVYLANSTSVRDRIWRVYGIEAELLHPPVMLRPDDELDPVPGLEPGFLLTVSRARGYKNTALVVRAARRIPGARLVVVGHLEAEDQGDDVLALSGISDARLRWLYANAGALVAASHEDFGLTPVEANTFGTPVVALRAGGYLDSITEGVNGIFFDREDEGDIARAVEELRRWDLDRGSVMEHARRFGLESFVESLQRYCA